MFALVYTNINASVHRAVEKQAQSISIMVILCIFFKYYHCFGGLEPLKDLGAFKLGVPVATSKVPVPQNEIQKPEWGTYSPCAVKG